MNAHVKAVLFGAVPSLVRAALTSTAVAAVAPAWGRARARRAERGREEAGSASYERALLRASTPAEAAAVLLDELAHAFQLDIANLAWIEGEGTRARIVAARENGAENAALAGEVVELDREPSGINTVVREGAPFAVYDAEGSEVVNRRLNERVRARSAVFVPVRAADRVVAVVFGAVRRPRIFEDSELASMLDLADVAGAPLERLHDAAALAEALERERLVARVARQVRAHPDLDESLAQALAETGRATGAMRCFVRLGDGVDTTSVLAEWSAGNAAPLGETIRLPVVNLAARERRTVAIGDVLDAPELDDVTLGDVRALTAIGVRSVVAAPIVGASRLLGVVAAHRPEPSTWSATDVALLEAVAREVAQALDARALLRDNSRQAQAERGFYRLAAVLSEPLSEQETVDAVAQAAAEALGGASAAVLRSQGSELQLVGGFRLEGGLAAALGRHEAGELAACARDGKVLAASQLAEDGRFGTALAGAAAAAGHGSLLAVPLPDAGDGADVVLVFFAGERAFEDAELELAAQVAAAARGALERSDLYERERRSRSLAQRLARAGRSLAGELDPENVLDEAIRHALALLGADGASVRVLERDEVVLRAASGPGEADAVGVRSPSTGWLVGDVVQTRATRAVEDVRDDSRMAEADPMLAAGYAGYLGVPMIAPDESAQGILAVYSLRPRRWREEEAEALHALAATAAAARSNAELYQGVSHEQQRGDAILANVADGIVAVDRDGDVVLWNPAAERITGVPQSEALGRTPLEALGRALDADEGAASGSRLLPIRRGGEEVWLSLSEAVMTDPAGAVAGRIYAFRDISSERSVEQMKTDFVSTVSHELRTPLTSIFGFAETLLRQDVLFGEEERRTFLRYISSESERLTAIVDRLISVAQLDTGDITVQLAETDVGAVVSDAVRTVEEAAGANGHRFVLDLDEGLAAEADREKLGQVLTHLLDNAIRYSPAGGTVTVAARRRDDAVEVSVEDEGIGIAHAEQQRIFRKFYRGDAAASGAVGAGATGLGLFLAEGLVTAMGGTIRVDSSEGKGSTFVLELRAAESET